MNENTLPPLALTQQERQDENRLIYIYPPMLCVNCDRLTSIALLNSALPHWFAPRCALHGYASPYSLYATPQEQADARTSIERFITWMHGDTGRCPVILEVPIDQVPGYLLNMDPHTFEPLAWHCRYVAADGERMDAFAVWNINANQFSLYEHGVQVSERREVITVMDSTPTGEDLDNES